MDWAAMLDEPDEEGAWGGSDGSSITLSDRDENGEVRVEGDCVPTEDLFVQFAASGDIDGLRLLLDFRSPVTPGSDMGETDDDDDANRDDFDDTFGSPVSVPRKRRR